MFLSLSFPLGKVRGMIAAAKRQSSQSNRRDVADVSTHHPCLSPFLLPQSEWGRAKADPQISVQEKQEHTHERYVYQSVMSMKTQRPTGTLHIAQHNPGISHRLSPRPAALLSSRRRHPPLYLSSPGMFLMPQSTRWPSHGHCQGPAVLLVDTPHNFTGWGRGESPELCV